MSAERYSLNFASQFARFTIAGSVQSSMAAAFGFDITFTATAAEVGKEQVMPSHEPW